MIEPLQMPTEPDKSQHENIVREYHHRIKQVGKLTVTQIKIALSVSVEISRTCFLLMQCNAMYHRRYAEPVLFSRVYRKDWQGAKSISLSSQSFATFLCMR